jgi:hypothetical protein
MSATRTQVYFTQEQRRALDERAGREGKSLAEIVRAAVDIYLAEPGENAEAALDATFGAIPDFDTPARGDWNRGYG